MPKFAYRLSVTLAYGSLYRSFRDEKAAMFMARQARAVGHNAVVTIYEADYIDPKTFRDATDLRGNKLKRKKG